MDDIKLVALDVDGVLREGSKLFYKCHKSALESVGMGKEFEKYFDVKDTWHFKGLGRFNDKRNALDAIYVLIKSGDVSKIHDIIYQPDAEDRISALVGDGTKNIDTQILDRMVEEYRKVVASAESGSLVRLYPGIEKLLGEIKGSGKMLAILTNSGAATLERDLGPILASFDYVITPKEVKVSKPSGEGLVLISRKSGVNIDDMIYVGDTVVDIRAAKNAGCRSVAVCTGMGLRQHLERENPDYIFKDLKEATEWIVKN